MLFDRSLIDQGKTGPISHDEGIYQYLATCNRPVCENVRLKLDEWISQYPEDHRWELCQRIKASANEFDSELFELLFHEVLRRLGLGLKIHPDLPDEVEKKPDFLVTDDDGNSLYIECVLATGRSEAEVAAENLIHSIYQKLDEKLRSPDYFWSVQVLSQDPQTPKAGAIIYEVAGWMRELDREKVVADFDELGFETSYKFLWSNGPWRIEFIPIPKDPAKVGIPHRPVGILRGGVQLLSDDRAILEAADFKAKRYGDGARPLAIAINATSIMVDGIDFQDAMFPRGVGRPGGFWMRDDGTLRNQNVVGIIGVWKCISSNFGHPLVRVINNPFLPEDPLLAKLPFSKLLCTPDGGNSLGGASFAEILELPPGWPE